MKQLTFLKVILLTTWVCSFWGCITQEESPNADYYAAIGRMKLSCKEGPNENAFEAVINNQKTC